MIDYQRLYTVTASLEVNGTVEVYSREFLEGLRFEEKITLGEYYRVKSLMSERGM